MKKCVECNTEVDEKTNVCTKCGGETFIASYSVEDVSSLLDSMNDRSEAKDHVDRGARFFMQGRYDEAINEYKKAIQINPLNATAHSNMGGALLEQGKSGEAIPWLEKALELNPNLEGVAEALSEAKTKNSECLDAEVSKDRNTKSRSTRNSLFSFEGRIKRSTFWLVIVPLFLISFGLKIGVIVSGNGELAVLVYIYLIPAVWIAFATYVKRWHDLNMSGWMVLTLFIPFANFLVLLYLGIAPGTTGINKYGDEPLSEA